MSFFIETNNLNKYLSIYEPGYVYSCGYYSQNRWVDDKRLVLHKYKQPEGEDAISVDLVLIDTEEQTEKFLTRIDGIWDLITADVVVHRENVYFTRNKNTLCCINVDTLEEKKIYQSDMPIIFSHITADGRYLNWMYQEKNDTFHSTHSCMRIDLKTLDVIKVIEKGFAYPYMTANHFMISPTDPDTVFFAHEGISSYVANRLWIAEVGKEPYNLAKQRFDENGDLIDYFGHESWAADGKGLYFIKYISSPTPPRGIGYVDLETRETKILYSKYKYWHVCAAPDGRHLAADLGPGTFNENKICSSGGVCLVDMENGTEEMILADLKYSQAHPGHQHPQFNPSSTKICFHNVLDDGSVTVGVVDI